MHTMIRKLSTHSQRNKIKLSQRVRWRLFCDWLLFSRLIFQNVTVLFSCFTIMMANIFLRYADTSMYNVNKAQTSVLSVKETSASLDSTQWNMTGNMGRKQMMSSRGHELVLNPWWQEHMVFTSSLLSRTDPWFIFKPKLRMCHWISLYLC